MITAESRESPPPLSCSKKRPCFEERSPSCSDESSSVREVSTVKKKVSPKRGRGRPPTTGQYVGLKKAKEEFLRLQRIELDLEAEKDKQTNKQKQIRVRQQSRSVRGPQLLPQAGSSVNLLKQVEDNLEIVNNVATKSKNLKGTFQRALKDASFCIRSCVETLAETNATEETRHLQEENAFLRSELTELRKEIAQLRAVNEHASEVHVNNMNTDKINEEQLSQSIIAEVGRIMTAKFKALEEKLLQEKNFIPPLRTNRSRKSSVPGAVPILTEELNQITVPEDPEPMRSKEEDRDKVINRSKPKKKSKKKNKSKTANIGPEPQHTNSQALPVAPVPENDGWVRVAKQRVNRPNNEKKDKVKITVPSSLRAPRSAAIVLTLKPAAVERGVSYASVLRKAKTTDLSGIGLTSIRVRKAATGARILEIPGATSSDKADEMAKRLETIFNQHDVRVARVTKCVEMRISELDDSVTKEEVAAAISQVGGCPDSQIRTGNLKVDNRGLFTIWVRCPVSAAKKIHLSGRILIGWVSARAKLLPPKMRHCWRCLETGHVREGCKSVIDRSNLCFRCGKPGHKANVCTAAPQCVLCADAKRSAAHTIGSRLCSAYSTRNHKKGQKATVTRPPRRQTDPTAHSARSGEEMVHLDSL